jgi:hypothetical protein
MPLDKQELAPGTKLVGNYKKAKHVCEVVTTPEGATRFRLEDGRLFNSPSSAAKAVMSGISANGWRFWSLEGTLPERAAKTERTAKASKSKLLRQIKKLPNQKGAAEGETKWFCSACMAGFAAPAGTEPEACPEGHLAQVEDELATPS